MKRGRRGCHLVPLISLKSAAGAKSGSLNATEFMTFHQVLHHQTWLPTVGDGPQPTSRGRTASGSAPSSIFDTTGGQDVPPEWASGQVRTRNASKVESLLMSGQKNHLSLTVQLQNIISQRNAGRKNNGTWVRVSLHRSESTSVQVVVFSLGSTVGCMLIQLAVRVFRKLTALIYLCQTFCWADLCGA